MWIITLARNLYYMVHADACLLFSTTPKGEVWTELQPDEATEDASALANLDIVISLCRNVILQLSTSDPQNDLGW